MHKSFHGFVAMIWLLLTSSAGAQNLYCNETPYWKVSSVARSANEGELLLAIETVDARGTPQAISVSATSGSTRYVMHQSFVGWTFAVHVLEDEWRRMAKIGTQAWCDGRMRSYEETVVPISTLGERA
jgi:hypothetical protein